MGLYINMMENNNLKSQGVMICKRFHLSYLLITLDEVESKQATKTKMGR